MVLIVDIDKIERLARLLHSGALSQEEFDQQKAELLALGETLQPQTSARSKWRWILAAIILVAAIIVAAKLLPGHTVTSAPARAPTQASASQDANSTTAGASGAQIGPPSSEAPAAQLTGATEFTDEESRLIDQWSEAEEMCRGSPDERSIATWCPRRDEAMQALNRASICYGREDDQSASDYQIHRCGESSFEN